ncbi:FAD-dependent oxidoreductase [Vibrio algarum]|uniref:FAD-binding protein n=1 Tax=Vibrio algarum TaxID=3020714 RepID=A0ABT4YUS8_9VIBR|nr:FAD-binding protein [Vibrio sp. KJ40-1]MDB1125298.1 FAD-binding protein [Vibrio sp. KJ40-1]
MSEKIDFELTTLETDVLVVGGGFAGCFAAVKAAEDGADVTMVVKGRTGRSGLTPWANSWFVYHDMPGITKDDYMKQFKLSGEYLNNQDFSMLLIDEAWDRFQEVQEWGTQTALTHPEEGRPYYIQHGTVSRSIEYCAAGDPMRRKALSVGVKMIERVMITDLIKEEGKVIGGIGFHMETGKPYAILAKATILCTGPSSLKPLGMGYPCSSTTADGDAMAIRVGAQISGKEFNDAHPANNANFLDHSTKNKASGDAVSKKTVLGLGGGPPSQDGPLNPEDLNSANLGLRIDSAVGISLGGQPMDEKYGRGPGGTNPRFSGAGTGAPKKMGFSTVGMGNHKGEGVFPQDINGRSNIEGLWAAGDAMCSMQNGAGYAGFGSSSSGSAVQGARSGHAVAEYVKTQPTPVPAPEFLEEMKQKMFAPINNEKGYSPAWVTRVMQGTMFPYFVMYVKEQSRMENALQQIKYLQNTFADNLKVEDFHELRNAIETRNMLLNAEMKLVAGMARKESRGTHYREDYPYRDEKNFLAWVKLTLNEEGNVQSELHPIPEKWHPEPSLSYREKYGFVYPNEDEERAKVGILD